MTPVTVCELDLPFVFGGQSFTQAGTFNITSGACGGGEVLVLTVNQAPVVTLASSTNASCSFGAIGSAQVSATGGLAPYTYQWNDANSQTGAQAVNLPAGTFTVVVTDRNGCSQDLTVTISMDNDCIDIALTKEVDRSVVTVGESVVFTITATNEGGAVATGVQVTDPVPSGFTNISGITNGGVLDGNTITWSDIDLGVGESITLTFSAEVVGDNVSYTNIAQVTAADQRDEDSVPNNDNGDQSEDDEDVASVIVSALDCDISLAIVSIQRESCTPGNDGIGEVVALDGEAPFLYIWSNGFEGSRQTGLAAGQYTVNVIDSNQCAATTTVVIDGEPNCNPGGGDNPGDGNPGGGDNPGDGNPGGGDNPNAIDLELIKRASVSVPRAGDTVGFQLTVFNNSSNDATGVEVQDVVPSGFTIIPSGIDNGGVMSSPNVATWSNLNIEAFGVIRLTVAVIVNESGDYTNVAQITAADQVDVDSTPGNDDGDQSEDDEDSATSAPETTDISIEKMVSNNNPRVRDIVTYTITVTNEGAVAATGVEVADYLPTDFCVNFTNISGNGLFIGDRIIWSDLFVPAGGEVVLTFDATVAASADGQSVTNLAEVTDMDQTDVDSEPGNLDRTSGPAQDDESMAVFNVGTVSDLELIKEVDQVQVSPNDEVQFSITITNNGPDPAFGVGVEDLLPDGYGAISNISDDGILTSHRLFWFIEQIPVNESVTLTFDATVVHFVDRECDYRNVAQIVDSFTADPDSTPDNDDGDQSEDDEDFAEVQLTFDNAQCVAINTGVFLEGAYNSDTELMSTNLNRLGYLPGQTPMTFFGIPTAAGQPYNQGPWFYNGTEGAGFNQQGPVTNTNGNYPLTVTDWVLVSLRTDQSAASTVCERAALLHNDGSIQFIDGGDCCNLDASLDYYVVIEHRNHLIVMSTIPLPVINGEITYDFRNRNSYQGPLAFGVGQKEVSRGVFAMFAGNGDQQDTAQDAIDINSNDLRAWLIDDGLNSSYFLRDMDLSGDVNVQDKALFLENNGLFSEVDRD